MLDAAFPGKHPPMQSAFLTPRCLLAWQGRYHEDIFGVVGAPSAASLKHARNQQSLKMLPLQVGG